MAKNINVNRNVQDPYYRYKMPRILAKVEGKGNGIKTVIANMSDIGKALCRPPTYPTKYFGCELGAQTNCNLKSDRFIVNGEHDANKLQDILDGFIRKFVLCPACDNPETTLTVKRNTIHSKCKACGHAFIIDPKHKISTFILKNPPTSEDGGEEKKDHSPAEDTIEGVDLNGAQNIEVKEDDDDDWAPEPLAETEKLSATIGKLVIDRDLDKSVEERLDMLHQYFINARDSGKLSEIKQLVNEAERLELKTKAPLLLADVIFTNDVLKQIPEHNTLLLHFCVGNKKAQRYLLGGIEQLIQKHPELQPKAAHILKALYDEEICEEESILAWGAKPSSKYVKKELSKEIIKVCEPLLTWLKEAEEESSSEEEDDDDDVAVDFDDRSKTIGTTIIEKKASQANGKENGPAPIIADDGQEVDIDDI